MQRPKHLQLKPRRSLRGTSLLDGLISLALLAFGMLALAQFQGRLVTRTTDIQSSLTATGLGDELLNMAIVDPDNVACYTLPVSADCRNDTARSIVDTWRSRVAVRLPGMTDASSTLDSATRRLKVVIAWTDKTTHDPRRLEVVSDASP